MNNELDPSYWSRLRRATWQDFKNFWSIHRLASSLITLLVSAIAIALQVVYRGVGSMANVEQTVATGVIGIAVSMIGTYLLSLGKAAKALDAGLRGNLADQRQETQKLHEQLANPKISSLEQSRRDLVAERLKDATKQDIEFMTHILRHGPTDEVALIRSAPRAEQHLYQAALTNGFGWQFLVSGPPGVGRHPVIINPQLENALSFHLLRDGSTPEKPITLSAEAGRRSRTPSEEENYNLAKNALRELGSQAERVLKHLIRIGEVTVRGNKDFHCPEGMSPEETVKLLNACKGKALVTSKESIEKVPGALRPAIDETYRISPGMLDVLNELLYRT